MNYVAQMNAFWSWRLLNQLNSRAADLYMALLHFNNLAAGKRVYRVQHDAAIGVWNFSD